MNFLSDVSWQGALASLIAGSATAIGAAAVFVTPSQNQKLKDAMMSFAAGIMLAATFFGLILPGIESAQNLGLKKALSTFIVVFGILAGTVAIWLLNRLIPHEHFEMGHHGPETAKHLKKIWLFVITIAIHNFPEGMAVGVGFAGDNFANGSSMTLGIALQNIPEGFSVAIALLAVGYKRLYSFAVASLTGLLEFAGGLVGVLAINFAQMSYPVILGITAGAMLFVISDEIIPETHHQGNESIATFCLIFGFSLMMICDVLLAF